MERRCLQTNLTSHDIKLMIFYPRPTCALLIYIQPLLLRPSSGLYTKSFHVEKVFTNGQIRLTIIWQEHPWAKAKREWRQKKLNDYVRQFATMSYMLRQFPSLSSLDINVINWHKVSNLQYDMLRHFMAICYDMPRLSPFCCPLQTSPNPIPISLLSCAHLGA